MVTLNEAVSYFFAAVILSLIVVVPCVLIYWFFYLRKVKRFVKDQLDKEEIAKEEPEFKEVEKEDSIDDEQDIGGGEQEPEASTCTI